MARKEVTSYFKSVTEYGELSITSDEVILEKEYSYFTGLYDEHGNEIHRQVYREPVGFDLGIQKKL